MASRRSVIAQDLRTPKYRPRVVRAKKGKGSYKRDRQRITRDNGGLFSFVD